MASIGTYSGSYAPFTFDMVIPEPGDDITFDWMEVVSQFSQRFMKIATSIVTIGHGSTYNFNYGSLGCDFFPPIVKVYTQDPTSGWREYNPYASYPTNSNAYMFISAVGLGTCNILNNTNASQTLLAIAYL